MARRPPRYTADANIPGAFEGETVTRRRFMTTTVHAATAIAASAIGLPVIGFAIAPVFHRVALPWQDVGPVADFPDDTYVSRVISLTADPVGEAARSTVFVRRRNPAIDTEPADRWNQYIALSSRCAHVGCPVDFKGAAQAFVCPCHGGVYDIQGKRIGGPPPRPLDRFFTRVRKGRLQIGPRYSVNSKLKRFSPRDPGEPLDGIGQYLYPPRPSTAPFPK
jgi:quinol---cytochrome c reductase iron-sulfur subunit, bacillus type